MSDTVPAKIAFYDAYCTLDGAGDKMRLIAQHLDRGRFEPVALLPHDGALADALRAHEIPVHILPPDAPLDSYGGALMASGPLAKVRAATAVRRHSAQVAGVLREVGAQLLHCNQTRAVLQAGMGGVRAGVPVVWNVRIRESLPRLLARYAVGIADHVIALTPDIMDELPGAERLREITTVIPNAVDTGYFSAGVDGSAVRAELGLAPDDPVVLMVALLAQRKAQDVLVRAAPLIVDSFPRARIVMVGRVPDGGDPSWRDHLLALAAELGVADSITLPGWREDVPEVLAACDVFVLPSRQEGFPAAVLEAMAVERPVVVTPPASAGVDDRATGRIVPVDDPRALADAVIDLLAHPPLAREMGREGRRRVEADFGLDAMVRRYEQVYTSLLADH